MGKPKVEVKKVRIDISTKRGAKELVALKQDGWEVISEHKRGALEWFPGQVDFVLQRVKGGGSGAAAERSARLDLPPTPAPTAGPPAGWYADPNGVEGVLRWWDGSRWTESTA